MGVALAFLLLVCKLTIAAGTISGLVFYANIVGVNRTTFLLVKTTDVLLVFIAWLNLDCGIETCFYDGWMLTSPQCRRQGGQQGKFAPGPQCKGAPKQCRTCSNKIHSSVTVQSGFFKGLVFRCIFD